MGGDAIDWGRHGQDKGQVSGGHQGWGVDMQTLCACRPRLCGLQTGVGGVSLGAERKAGSARERVHGQSAGGPTCGGLLGLVLVKLGGERQAVRCREGPRGLPIQKMHRRPWCGLVSVGAVPCPSIPRGPGSREQQDEARKLVFSFR